MENIHALKTIGLTENEAKVYLALLEQPETTVLPLAKRASVPRTYCYDLLASLSDKGFVSFVEKRGRRRYLALDPRLVKQTAMEKMRAFETALPNLITLYSQSPSKPNAQFFEGKAGLLALHNTVLAEATEILIFGSGEQWVHKFSDYRDFIKALVKKGVKIRDLVKEISETAEYKSLYAGPAQQMHYARDEWIFPADCGIWGDKVAFISYSDQMHGIIIESKEIATAMKTVFDVLWEVSRAAK